VSGQLFVFSFKPLKFSYSVKRKNNVLHERWHKKHDGKNYRRAGASGRAKKTGGVLINTFKINQFHLLKRLGFLPCWAGLAVGLISTDGIF